LTTVYCPARAEMSSVEKRTSTAWSAEASGVDGGTALGKGGEGRGGARGGEGRGGAKGGEGSGGEGSGRGVAAVVSGVVDVMDSIVPDGSPAFIGSHNQPGDELLNCKVQCTTAEFTDAVRTAPGHSSHSTFHTRSFHTGSPFLIR